MNSLYTAFKLLVALAVASLVGLAGTLILLDADVGSETATAGPWTAHIPLGRDNANPYVRAALARSGAVPLAATEMVVLAARRDSAGERLQGGCDYVLRAGRIDARWWTLSLTDTDGRLIGAAAARHAFNSADVLRDRDGSFTITLSPRAAAGNWLPSADAGALLLTLRLYDTGLYVNGGLPEATLFSITRGDCA